MKPGSVSRWGLSLFGLSAAALFGYSLAAALYFEDRFAVLNSLDRAHASAAEIHASLVFPSGEAPAALVDRIDALAARVGDLRPAAPAGLGGHLRQLKAGVVARSEGRQPEPPLELQGRLVEYQLDRAHDQQVGAMRREAAWALVGLLSIGGLTTVIFGTLFWRIHRRMLQPLARIPSTLRRLREAQFINRDGGTGTPRVRGVEAATGDLEGAVQQFEQQLRDELDLRNAVIDSLPAQIALLDANGTVRHVNERWRQFARDNGYEAADMCLGADYLAICDAASGECSEEAEAVAAGLRAVLRGEQTTYAQEYPCHAPDQRRWFRVMITGLSAGRALEGGVIVMHVDITERKLAEERVHDLAYRDALTGLATPVALRETMDQRAEGLDRTALAYLVLLDVIQFHDINEAHGYEVGDRLLIALGRRLGAVARGQAQVARYGSDSFAVYLTLSEPTRPDRVANAIHEAVAEPFRGVGFNIQLEARMSVVDLVDCPTAMEAFRRAELTLSTLRRGSSALSLQYSPNLEEDNQARIQISDGLRQALAAGAFELHYQPKVDIRNGEMVAAEGLIRWRHPTRGLMPPASFIPVAESSQLIVPMGEWTIYQACRDLKAWQQAGIDIVEVSVNVSVKQFALSDVAATVTAALQETGLPPQSLCLEITESVFAADIQYVKKALQDLHEVGVRLALDDFGTGYSSLQYLQEYPFNEIKVDRAFVSRLTTEPYSEVIVRMVRSIAESLGATVVAEGIETRAQRDALLALGCYTGQGFYYSMPLEREDFTWLLSERSTLPLASPMIAP